MTFQTVSGRSHVTNFSTQCVSYNNDPFNSIVAVGPHKSRAELEVLVSHLNKQKVEGEETIYVGEKPSSEIFHLTDFQDLSLHFTGARTRTPQKPTTPIVSGTPNVQITSPHTPQTEVKSGNYGLSCNRSPLISTAFSTTPTTPLQSHRTIGQGDLFPVPIAPGSTHRIRPVRHLSHRPTNLIFRTTHS